MSVIDSVKQVMDFINFYAFKIGAPPEVYTAIHSTFGHDVAGVNLDDIQMTTGYYVLYCDVQNGFEFIDLEKPLPLYTDEGKKIQVNYVIYHAQKQTVEIGLRIYQNPIPMAVVWALVVGGLAVVTLLASHLVLTDVKKVVLSPAGFIVLALAGVCVLYITYKKKG